MAHSFEEQVLSLAGIFQAAVLVEKIARTGNAPEDSFECTLASILITNPGSVEDVYQGRHGLYLGLTHLKHVLERDRKSMTGDAIRYVLTLMQLEKKLSKNNEMLATLGNRLEQIEQQRKHFDVTHENIVGALASLYQDTLSTFSSRIHVTGDVRHLQSTDNAQRIRACLLGGIRSTMLWRQVGGYRWQLILGRKKMLDCVNHLLRP
ncbi:high frequency lysogenization protein HflD [Aestuariirhabdus sp. Z084]|uniref:high frequency lysogenization protein HflD n=1 Tax=Aestuariirhabdus haliotis TaxID=2918751 RepID=UPI00201B40CD|nr:high frequency lysogenization protein HflD [Aestuariirhabdus haliotis]MCL6414895.1 high frequency lysogenization protein HflD [Aestuariirhabdus haliotis]MCL6418827.1 high frequency lysogenization protein HflD [Aestuariirhabdus haliotis]